MELPTPPVPADAIIDGHKSFSPGGHGGMSGLMLNGTQELLLHCGGADEVNNLHSAGCYLVDLEVIDSTLVLNSINQIASMPYVLR